ncbi:MAG: Lrp/AsnC family transcriptional regulator [Sphaerochaetaceae bacterium]|jgi:Lrp/AsnC family transcriptional regulator for asnA, asnC and gidA|nr:Lrp/AsnC family transcriptional regulator [Sphaerochaetaceae bacterium]
MKDLDDTNKAILQQLSDGRKPFSLIAEELGITENTVRSRVNRLMEDGILKICGLVDPEKVMGLQIALMGIKLKTLNLDEKAAEFTKLKGVISAVVVTGRFDIIIQVLLSDSDDYTLLDFFKKELSKISDVADVETFVVYQGHNYLIPYIL